MKRNQKQNFVMFDESTDALSTRGSVVTASSLASDPKRCTEGRPCREPSLGKHARPIGNTRSYVSHLPPSVYTRTIQMVRYNHLIPSANQKCRSSGNFSRPELPLLLLLLLLVLASNFLQRCQISRQPGGVCFVKPSSRRNMERRGGLRRVMITPPYTVK